MARDDWDDDEDDDSDDDWESDDDSDNHWDGAEVFDWDEWLEHYEDGYFEDAEYEEADGGIDYSGE